MLVKTVCPSCNGQMEIDDSKERIFCPYCGTQIVNLADKIQLSGKVSVDRSTEPNVYINFASTLPTARLVVTMRDTGVQNVVLNGQTMTYHLTNGYHTVNLLTGTKNFDRIIFVQENAPVRINGSFDGGFYISIDQPPFNNPDGTVGAITQPFKKEYGKGLAIFAFVLSLLVWTSPIGFILGIVDCVRRKKAKKSGFAIWAIIIGILFSIFLVYFIKITVVGN